MIYKEKSASKNNLFTQPTGILVLENGLTFKGHGIGYEGYSVGEVCFNTSMTGYQEIITDPSYADQIINFTFPHIGNVGANSEDIECENVWLKGVIFNKDITSPSNYRSLHHLNKWLKINKIVGLCGVDTREITNLIRKNGSLKGAIVNQNKKLNIKFYLKKSREWPGLKGLDLASKVSVKQIYKWNNQTLWKKKIGYEVEKAFKYHIVAIDFGIKKNILRNFSNLNARVTVVPINTSLATTIIKLNTLSNSIWATTNNYYFLLI